MYLERDIVSRYTARVKIQVGLAKPRRPLKSRRTSEHRNQLFLFPTQMSQFHVRSGITQLKPDHPGLNISSSQIPIAAFPWTPSETVAHHPVVPERPRHPPQSAKRLLTGRLAINSLHTRFERRKKKQERRGKRPSKQTLPSLSWLVPSARDDRTVRSRKPRPAVSRSSSLLRSI